MTLLGETVPGSKIDRDLACAQCRYNLRGLSSDGTCPECGHFVRRSFYAHQLKLSRRPRSLWGIDRTWLRHVREGLWLTLLATLSVAALSLLPLEQLSLDAHARPYVIGALSCLAGIAWLGMWKISRPGPLADAKAKRSAWVTRAAATAPFLSILWFASLIWWDWFTFLALTFYVLGTLFSIGLLWWHVGRLLQCADASTLAALANLVGWIQAGSLAIGLFTFHCSRGAETGNYLPPLPGQFLDSESIRQTVVYSSGGGPDAIALAQLFLFVTGILILGYALWRTRLSAMQELLQPPAII